MTQERHRLLERLFGCSRPLIGIVHLLPLPGSPAAAPMEAVISAALADAAALEAGGASGLVIENFGDAPFASGRVEAVTVAAMAVVAREVRRHSRLPMGINVLRNDAVSALSIATVVGAGFIRVNVLSGAMVADQGIIQGDAYTLLRLRRALGAEVAIFADVLVKHAVPLGPQEVAQVARDTAYRAGADALIVSGGETGAAVDLDRARVIRAAVPDRPLLVGSGATSATIPALLSAADGVLIGTSIKVDGIVTNRVDPARVREAVAAVQAAALR